MASYTYHPYTLITAPKIHTDLLWDLTVLFIGLAAIYFIAIFFINKIISSRAKKSAKFKKELSPIVSEFIFIEDDASKDEKSNYIKLKLEVRELLKDPINLKSVSELLLELRKDVSGVAQDRLFDLYQDLGLHTVSYRKLKSWRWEVVSQGIQELTQMGVTEAYVFLTKLINDKRSTIRKQAEIAVVTLKHEGMGYFLNTTKHKISEWQQLKLLEVVRNKPDYLPPSFRSWLTSKNKYVVMFALRLIKHYNQNDADAAIIELVKHRNNQIKQEAIECIRAFHLVLAIGNLKAVFWNCTADTKIAILEALGDMGSEEEIEFLQLIEKKEFSFAVRSKALSAINSIAPGSILPTEDIVDTSTIKIPLDLKEGKLEKMQAERSFDDIINATIDPIVTSNIPNSSGGHSEEPAPAPVSEHNAKDEVKGNDMADDHLNLAETPTDLGPVAASITENDPPVTAETDKTLRPEPAIEADTLFQIDFLPIVVDARPEQKMVKNDTYPVHGALDVKDLEVVYDEIKLRPDPVMPSPKPYKEIDIDLAFIPIVIEDNAEVPVTTKEHERTTASTPKIPLTEIPVIFEEITVEESKIAPIRKVADMEVVCEVIRVDKTEEEQLMTPLLELEVLFEEIEPSENSKVSDIEVLSETGEGEKETESAHLPQWLLEEISISVNKTSQKIDTMGPNWETKSAKMWLEIDGLLQIIPPPTYYDHEVAEKMILLDNIELYGDGREIELLQELMQQETDRGAQLRVRDILENFLKQWKVSGVKNNAPENVGKMGVYSVFEDFFRPCDTESKLILLDEIPSVADEKEIPFLKKLLSDNDARIREKAAKSLAKLQSRLLASGILFKTTDGTLQSDSTMEVDLLLDALEIGPPIASDIFEIDFEINIEQGFHEANADAIGKEKNEIGSGTAKESIFQGICWLTNLLKPSENG